MKTSALRTTRIAFAALALGAVATAACTTTVTFVDPINRIDSSVDPFDGGSSDAQADASKPFAKEFRDLLEIEDQRLIGDTRLKTYLQSTEPSVQARALEVAGRNVDTTVLVDVLARLSDGSTADIRAAAAWALYGYEPTAVRAAVMTRIGAEKDPAPLSQLYLVLSKVGDPVAILPLLDNAIATTTSMEVRRAATFTLSRLFARGTYAAPAQTVSGAAFDKLWDEMRGTDAATRNYAAFSVRYLMTRTASPYLTTARTTQLVNDYQGFTDESVRMQLASKLRNLGTPEALATMRSTLTSDPSPAVRTAMVWKFDAAQIDATTVNSFVSNIKGAAVQPAVNAIRAMSYYQPESLGAHLAELQTVYSSTSSMWLKSELLPLLVQLDSAGADARIASALTDNSDVVRAAALRLYAVRGGSAGANTAIAGAGDANLPLSVASFEALGTLIPVANFDAAAVKTALRAALTSGNVARVRGAIDAITARNAQYDENQAMDPPTAGVDPSTWIELMPELTAAADAGEDYMRQSVLKLAARYKRAADQTWVDKYIEADEPWVGREAADAHKAITGQDVSNRVRTSLKVRSATPSDADIALAQNGVFEFETSRGTYKMKPLGFAPVTIRKLYETITKGEYDGLRVYRHEPGQLFQFGSPTYFDTGNTLSMRPRTVRSSQFANFTGSVGNGRQTDIDNEGSTLFFNLTFNEWIDLDYTPIGNVIEGLPVVQSLELGDTIVKARFIPNAN